MMIGCTVPEIRRLLATLFVRSQQPEHHLWWWSRGAAFANTKPALSHYRQRGYLLRQVPLQC
jgi:hypothetical protein